MKIPNYNDLNGTAQRQLSRARDSQKIALLYALMATIAAALVTGIQFALDSRISQTGGLGNLGIRSFLSSIAQFLPVVQMIFTLVLDFGYLACMVRISRGQYTSPRTLKAGVDRLWPLVRLNLLKTLIYSAIGFGSFYIATSLFLFSPFSTALVDLLSPYASSGAIPALDAETQLAILAAMRPAFFFVIAVLLVLFPPMFYRYRMADFVLYDHPEAGAVFAMRESRMMMRRNRMDLFKLDLRFWWYYALYLLVPFVAYGDMFLAMAGVTLPFSDNVSFFLFYFVSLGIQFALFYYLRNRITTVYALAYQSLLPPKKEDNGVVLGNIFQM